MGAAKKLYVADLFCGAGGTSTGLALACKELGHAVELLAINHWGRAIETHKKNHPWARHLCASLETLDPRKVVPGGHLDLLVASPECTHHSVARGGRPVNDQSRASAFRVLEWCDKLHVSNVLVENVPEFENWSPIGENGRPLKSKRGEIFRHWIGMLRGMNYRVEWRVLNSADYGGATTRRRLFILARKGSRRITWPEPTHSKDPGRDLFGTLKPWRAAREIIDWNIPGESIFTRKRPLARTTLERIAAGLRKFCGEAAEPFLVILRRHMDGKSIDEPIPCLTASGQHIGIAVPQAFVLQQQSGGAPRSVEEPLPTIAGKGAQGFIVPFFGEAKGQKPRTHDLNDPLPAPTSHGAGALVQPAIIVEPGHGGPPECRAHSVEEPLGAPPCSNRFAVVKPEFIVTPGGPDLPGGRSVEAPLPVVTCKDRMAVVEPYVVNMKGRSDASSIDKPLPTQTTQKHLYVAEPAFVVGAGGPERAGKPVSVDKPLGTALTREHKALVEPIIIPLNHGAADKRSHSIDDPMPCLTTVDAWAIFKPHLVKFYRDPNTQNQSIDEPLHTVPTKDRFGLVEPTIGLDIRFRMLRPHELARAMGFEKYEFTGTREEQVKQIGNAVEVNTAKALVRAILES